MAKFTQQGFIHDEFKYEDGEVLCHCGLRASRRVSRTIANPGRKFFGCPRYSSKVEKGCGYFVWFEVKVAALKEKQELLPMVDNLQLQVQHLKEQNEWLQTQMDDGVVSSGSNVVQNNKYNLISEIEMLKFRIGVIESSGCCMHKGTSCNR
ncbi:hypothetical protein LINGRAHAP2_LOCUS30120 [Linum grandiflorum]